MKVFFLVVFILIGSAVADNYKSEPNRVVCYAKAGLGIFDVHGLHEGYGETIREASAEAMIDCRKQHALIGCIPVPGCK